MTQNYGFNIKKIRELKGYSQDYVAMKLNIKQESYNYIENKQKNIPEETLDKIAEILEVEKSLIKNFDLGNIFKIKFHDQAKGFFNINQLFVDNQDETINALKESNRLLVASNKDLEDKCNLLAIEILNLKEIIKNQSK